MSGEVENFLAHFGVKGMKWGVRRAIGTSNGKPATRKNSRPSDSWSPARSATSNLVEAALILLDPHTVATFKVADAVEDVAAPKVAALRQKHANKKLSEMEVKNGTG